MTVVQFQAQATSTQTSSETSGTVVDLQAFRSRKALSGDRKAGLGQTFRTSQEPEKSLGSGQSVDTTDADLSERIERIKSSISRINQLMSELRTMSSSDKASPHE